MRKLQLYINNTRVDLFKDEIVSINASIQDIKDPAKIFTEFTKAFTIPASKTNNKLFQHLNNGGSIKIFYNEPYFWNCYKAQPKKKLEYNYNQ